MLKFYQFERKWGIPNLSPFFCKTETYLRVANIEYEIKMTLPSEAPKGKLPYIEDGDEVLADSGFIALHLKRSGYRVESSRTGTIYSNAAFA
jgi:hypothetical protein